MTQPAPPAEDTAQEPHPGVLTRLEKLKEALQSENTQATKKTLDELESYRNKNDSP